jgi:hypothetical protein
MTLPPQWFAMLHGRENGMSCPCWDFEEGIILNTSSTQIKLNHQTFLLKNKHEKCGSMYPYPLYNQSILSTDSLAGVSYSTSVISVAFVERI